MRASRLWIVTENLFTMISEIKDRTDEDAGLITPEQLKLFVDRMLANSHFNDEYVAADKDYEKKVPIGRYLLQLELWTRRQECRWLGCIS